MTASEVLRFTKLRVPIVWKAFLTSRILIVTIAAMDVHRMVRTVALTGLFARERRKKARILEQRQTSGGEG